MNSQTQIFERRNRSMVPAVVLLLIAGMGVGLGQAPADLENDFSTGMDKWRGDGTLATLEDKNAVCELKKTSKRTQEITHKIELDPEKSYLVSLKVRALPGGEKIKFRMASRSNKGAGFVTIDLEPDGKWLEKSITVKSTAEDRADDKVVALIFHEGEGVIQIDDIKVTEQAR